jgi:NDP-sugar pyrophosphorylase family protein
MVDHITYKVLITTSGTGSRLGDLTKHTNKALVLLNGKPAISYIINSYPADTNFVITVGYLGGQVKEALVRLYPSHQFSFVEVDKYEGPGSSLGYSMLQAGPYLQCPFIFHACDTLIFGHPIPAPKKNWMGGHRKGGDISQYRTIEINDAGNTVNINEKKQGTSDQIFIGFFGINDYALYWKSLRKLYNADPLNQNLNDTMPLNDMLTSGESFDLISFPTWLDTGNPTAFEETIKYLAQHHESK